MLFLQAKTEAFTMKSVNIFFDTLTASFLWDVSYGELIIGLKMTELQPIWLSSLITPQPLLLELNPLNFVFH